MALTSHTDDGHRPHRVGAFATTLMVALATFVAGIAAAQAEGAPASLVTPTGDLFLTGAGALGEAPGSTSTACASLTDAGPGQGAAAFEASPIEGVYHPLSQTIVATLALADGARSGTGFRVEASVTFGNGTSVQAAKSFGSGTAVESPITLGLPVNDGDRRTGQGPVVLALTLAKTAEGALPPAGQNVQVLCDHSDSKLFSFNLVRGAVGDTDADGDGVPDSVDPEIPSQGEGETDHEGGNIQALSTGQRLGVAGVASLAGLVTLAAGLLVLAGRTISERRIHLLLGATAGLLLAIALVDLVPEALEQSEAAGWTIALGVLGLLSIRWIIGERGHGHGREAHDGDGEGHHPHEVHAEHHPAGHPARDRAIRLALVAFGALLVHRIVDGLALPGAWAAGGSVGLAAGFAILAHQFPDGLAAGSIFVGSGLRRIETLRGVGALSFATPVGAVVGLFFAGISGFLPYLLALAAATFIFIALSELIPELRDQRFRWTVAAGFLIGYGLTYALELVANWAGVHA